VASCDARLKFAKNWVVNLQAARAWTRQDALAGQNCLSFTPNAQGVGSQDEMRCGGRFVYRKAFYVLRELQRFYAGILQRTGICQIA